MNKKYLIGGVILIVVIGIFLLNQGKDTSPGQESKQSFSTNNQITSKELTPVSAITHGHGLAVDVTDPNIIYIATHHGLLVLKNEKDLYQVGNSKDDYMGFSPHPTDPKTFFSSGHPATGGNIGFQKSEDGGFSWEKISDGLNGPVDFHAMTVSPINPKLIYGWFQGALQRTSDEGKTWQIAGQTDFSVVNLTADPKDENIIYAASPQGLMVSKNKGESWNTLIEGFVSTVAIDPNDSQKLLSFSEKHGMAGSSDGGLNWEKFSERFNEETPLFISFSKQNPEIVYTLTEKNSIFKSINSGIAWSKIR